MSGRPTEEELRTARDLVARGAAVDLSTALEITVAPLPVPKVVKHKAGERPEELDDGGPRSERADDAERGP